MRALRVGAPLLRSHGAAAVAGASDLAEEGVQGRVPGAAGGPLRVADDPGVALGAEGGALSCYLCLRPAPTPAMTMSHPTAGAVPFMVEPGTTPLCTECRQDLGRPWDADKMRWPLAESGPAAQRLPS
jgi:hypothetical protein